MVDNAYTVADVARAIGVEPATVRAYKSRGQMPSATGVIGRTPFWVGEMIEPWIKARGGKVRPAPKG